METAMTLQCRSDLDADIVELVPYIPSANDAQRVPLREMAFRQDAWLPDEIDRLRRVFVDDSAIDDIATMLGRPRAGVATKIGDLGLRRNSVRPWSEWDDAELLARYASEPTARLAAELGRGASAVYARARLLGLSEPAAPPYDGWEDAQIAAGYRAGVPVGQIAGLIGRPISGVLSRASALGLRHAAHPADWLDAELARALELAHQGMRYLAIIEALVGEGYPRRSKQGLGPRLRKLGYGRGWGRSWLAEEDALLRQAYATGASLTPLIERLGRSTHSIRHRVGELGLRGTHRNRDGFRQGPVWSDADNARLREAYGKVPSPELAAELGRGLRAMLVHAHALGLRHGFMRAFSADEDRAIRNAWAGGISLTDLAQALGRDIAVVSKHAIRLGYRFSDPDRPCKAPRSIRARRPPITLPELLAEPSE